MTISLDAFMWSVGILLSVVIALIGFIVNYILKSQSTASKSMETTIFNLKAELYAWKLEVSNSVIAVKKEQDEIKYNYLKRFDGVNTNIYNVKEEVISKLHDLHTLLIEKNNQ